MLVTYVSTEPFQRRLYWSDGILYTWVFSLIIDEGSQLYESGFPDWIADFWNKLDFCIITSFLLGTAIRLSLLFVDDLDDSVLQAAKNVYGLSSVFFWLRLLRVISVFDRVGPILLIIGKMMRDVAVFLSISAIFMIACGVCFVALLYPNYFNTGEQENGLIWRILFWRPLYQLLGDTYLDEIQCATGAEDSKDCSDGRSPALGPFLLWVYMLVGNVVMVNLLIAMMSDTYSLTKENSQQICRIQRYTLMKEYEEASFFPPPLNIIQVIIKLLTSLHEYSKNNIEKQDIESVEEEAHETSTADDREKTMKSFMRNARDQILDRRKIEKREEPLAVLASDVARIEEQLQAQAKFAADTEERMTKALDEGLLRTQETLKELFNGLETRFMEEARAKRSRRQARHLASEQAQAASQADPSQQRSEVHFPHSFGKQPSARWPLLLTTVLARALFSWMLSEKGLQIRCIFTLDMLRTILWLMTVSAQVPLHCAIEQGWQKTLQRLLRLAMMVTRGNS
jgi:hypothetical protein